VATPTSIPETPNTFYTATLTVTLATETQGAEIHYATDGIDPTPESALYSNSVTIEEGAGFGDITLKAIAIKTAMNTSEILTAVYTKWGSGPAVYRGPGLLCSRGENRSRLNSNSVFSDRGRGDLLHHGRHNLDEGKRHAISSPHYDNGKNSY
jgi:hypothetical protein